jgi:hypothetical protein
MPAGLLDQLNEHEALDLIADVLSHGSKKDPRFAKPSKQRQRPGSTPWRAARAVVWMAVWAAIEAAVWAVCAGKSWR